MAPASGLGDVRAWSSKVSVADTKNVTASSKGWRIQLTFMLGVASPVELQESSPHHPTPKTLEEAPTIAVELAMTSAAADATTSLPIVTATACSRATTSLAFATASFS
jgi:hypothetical protein